MILDMQHIDADGDGLALLLRRLAADGVFATDAGVRQLVDGRRPASGDSGWFEERPYAVRSARRADLPALEVLEALCWDAPLRATAAELTERLRAGDNAVLELHGEVVGVVYSQRIAAVDDIFGVDFRRAASLRRSDGPVRQLLAINVHPEAQSQGLGDTLLEFVLQLAAFEPGVERVVGVTRCGGTTRSTSSLADYVAQRDADGLPVDPILAFHAAHGARIGPLVDGYRPPDTINGGAGVLVEYDPRARLTVHGRAARVDGPLDGIVDDAVRDLMTADAFERDRPLRELGFDSFRLVRLRAVLERRLGRPVRPTIFFRHNTAAALAMYFESPTTPRRQATPIEPLEAAGLQASVDGDPIAIVGMACRLPGGVEGPADFWTLLDEGRDAIAPIPADRFGGAPTGAPAFGGFLDGIADFDAAFFRIAPVEANAMDPQQRLLLETHWQALEYAGIDPTSLAGSDVGVFVGVFAEDYKLLQARRAGPPSTYFGTGTANSIAAGRVAYVLGTRGPAMVVDTACSSSLVAVHQAVRSLRSGESTLALASGVNLILSPELSEVFSRAGMLAADGRCKTFDAAADGYVRSEGCGVVVLERLSSARAHGRRVLGLIRGTAVNQDGASNGLTAPNGSAQEAVIRKALADAELPATAIDYVEAHGTGTPLGDPIEVEALDAVYGAGRPAERPLVVGSVKTNIGHTESAAGIAGLLKAVLALEHSRIPRNLHCQTLNPLLARARVRVPTEPLDWPRGEAPRRAGISSFGFSGTNAHVIVEEAPGDVPRAGWRSHHLLTLSARTPGGLRALVGATARALEHADDAALADIAGTSHIGRAHHPHRLAVVGDGIGAIEDALDLALGDADDGPAAGVARQPPAVVFLFTGQGAQYLDMGRALYATQPVFRDRLDRCDAVAREALGRSLIDLLYPEAEPTHDDLMTDHACGQAVNYAVEAALADVWLDWGVEPIAVLGHSLGDFAAAYCAGVLTLEDGLRLVIERGRLMSRAAGQMAAVRASEADVEARIAELDGVTIGVINGPRSLVISGRHGAVQAALERLGADGIDTRVLDIPVAAHSPMLDPVLDRFESAVGAIELKPPTRTVISGMTGAVERESLTTAGFWRAHLRRTVRFADGVATAVKLGATAWLEVGPRSTLLGLAEAVVDSMDAARPVPLPSLDPGADDWQRMLTSLGELYVRGAPIRWAAVDGPYVGRVRGDLLPTYPFERQRFWFTDDEEPASAVDLRRVRARLEAQGHVGEAIESVLRAIEAEQATADGLARTNARSTRIEWVPQTVGADAHGRWLILGGASAAPLARLLRGDVASLDADWPARLDRWLASSGTASGGIVYLAPPGREPVDGAGGCADVLRIARRMRAAGAGGRLWIVTRGAQPAGGPVAAPGQAALWGMGRSLALEQPTVWGGLIDLDPSHVDPSADARALVGPLCADIRDDQWALRGQRWWVPRLIPAGLPARARSLTLHPDAGYLITGGLGNVGLRCARWLVDRGARRLILCGRRGAHRPDQAAAVDALRARGVDVRVAAVDVADAEGMARLFAALDADDVSLRGIIHGAGIARFADISEARPDDFAAALRPKLQGALVLHRLTAARALDFFVCHTSGAGVWGGRGQTHYAAANHALDALMSWRRAQGLPGQAISWGLWAGGGMVDAETRDRLTAGGLRPLEAVDTAAVLDRVVGDPAVGELTAADVDWDRLAALLSLHRPRPFLDGLVASTAETVTPDTPALVSALRTMPRPRRAEHLAARLSLALAGILGLSGPLERRVGFRDLGLDSIMALDLRRRLERLLGCRLPATLAFEFPTIERLSAHLLDRLDLDDAAPSAEPRPAPAAPDEGIAVVSLACRFPGADDPDAFWSLLAEGRDTVGEIPVSRGRIAETIRFGACLADIEGFDAAAFGIAPREAAAIDPQHRLLLEVGWEAVERAGLWGPDLAESRTGIFVGIGTESGGDLSHADAADIDAYALTGSSHNAAPGRLAHLLGVQGPVMAVDTACSSSLVALHLACRSLRAGECDRALAAGVSLMLSENTAAALSRMQVLAPDGRCKTFDAAADGYGRGEGCGVVVLERLADARATGRDIIAVIRGSAVNHDGTSSGLTVPNPQAQQRLVRAALDDAGIEPHAVDYIEAHGTGTPLGDPIELRALAGVFGPDRARPLVVGTVKTNIGHLEAASGIAGFIKVALAVHRAEIPRHLHYATPSPHIDGLGALFEIPTARRPWPVRAPRAPAIAGVSSFGISGTNAHVLVAAPPAPPRAEPSAAEPMAHLLPLSARDATALRGLAARYVEHLDRNPSVDPGDLCHTGATGRRHMGHRAALVADDRAALRASLDALAAGDMPTATGDAAPRTVWLFTGQGAQSVGMGRRLYATCPPFRAALDDCADRLAARGIDLFGLIAPDADPARLEDTAHAQPALFALELALARVWLGWGIEPVALVGHSLGEIVAATLAGVFDLDDALDLVVARGRLMGALPRTGRMVALTLPAGLTADDVAARLVEHADVDLAAINAPDSVVVSGDAAGVEALAAELAAAGAKTRELRVSHAFHSPLMDTMVDDFRVIAQGITYHTPTRLLISALTGAAAGPEVATADYWVRHVRQPVRFADALQTALDEGPHALLEIGPHPVLLGMAGRMLDGAADAPQMLPSLRRKRGDRATMLGSLGALYRLGLDVDWAAVHAGEARRRVIQPTYAFQRRAYPLRTRRRSAGPAADLDALAAALPMDRLGPAARAALPEIMALMASVQRSGAIDATVDDWLYAPTWQPAGPTAVAEAGAWLVLGGGPAGAALVAQLRRDGCHAMHAMHAIGSDVFEARGDGIYSVDRAAPHALDALLDAAAPAHIVDLCALECPALGEAVDLLSAAERMCGGLMRLVQTLQTRRATPRLWLVTAGARAVRPGDAVDGVVQNVLAGLLPVLALEHPELRLTVVDVHGIDGIAGLADVLARPPLGEDSLALRDGEVLVERLTRDRRRGAAPRIRSDASYLIVGGTGGLGLQIAGWFVERGAGHVVLMARSAPKNDVDARLERWRADGARVSVARCDVTDGAALAAALDTIEPPLAGVVHAATARDGGALLADHDWTRFAAMLAPKLLGAAHLHRLTADRALDLFVCFSSLTTVFGDLGLSAYVAANAFLDGLAHHRRARGLPATTIDWGIWSDVGAAVDMSGELDRMTRRGHGRIAPDHGVAAFARLLGVPAPQVLTAPVDWARFAEGPTARRFERLLPAPAPVDDGAASEEKTAPATPTDPRGAMLAEVLALARGVLALDPSTPLGPGDDLLDLGLDSLMAVELRDALRARYGGPIALGDILDSESGSAIVDRLLASVDGLAAGAVPAGAVPAGAVPTASADAREPDQPDATDEWEEGEL